MISKRFILVLALALAGMAAKGQNNYVFMYSDYIFGQTTSVSTEFVPNNCIYTGTSGGTFRNGNGYYIVYANNSVSFDQSTGSNLTINNNNYLYYDNTYYLRYSASANNNQGGWQFRNQYNVQAIAYVATTSSVIGSFSISGDATIITTGTNSSYTHTNAEYYDRYSFNSLTYYSTNPSVAASTTMPTSGLPTLSDGYTWSISANSYATVNSATGAITVNSLPTSSTPLTLTCSVTRNGVTQTASMTVTLENPIDPTSITATTPITVYVGTSGAATYTLNPSGAYDNVTGTTSDAGIFTVGAISNGSVIINPVAVGSAILTLTAHKLNGDPITPSAVVTVNVHDICATPTITFTQIGDGATANTTITSTTGADIFYTINGADPTISSTHYTGPFEVNDGEVVRAIAVMTGNEYWDNSAIATEEYHACSTDIPVITYTSANGTANVTITAETGATIYYTYGNDPADPTPTSYTGTGTTSVTFSISNANGQVVKAIAKNGGCSDSGVVSVTMVVSGISGSQVILYDLEDHNWSYYNAAPDTDYPSGNILLSPEPRNVKITYRGGSVAGASAVAVSTTEPQNEFVYYKTIENLAWGNSTGRWLTGEYAYRTIPNPFSKRPRTNGTTGTNGFWGFNGWKVISGGQYIQEYGDGQTIPADQLIHFVGLPAGNNGSGEIVLEAQWTAASVVTRTTDINSNPNGLNGTSYETNFIVYTDNGIHTVSGLTTEATISSNYPNGDPAGSNGPATISNFTTSTAAVKLEYIKIGDGNTPIHPINPTTPSTTALGNGTFTANSGELIVGRGCTGTVNYFCSGGNGGQYKYRIESGKYQFMFLMSSGSANANNYGRIVLGCDYDRAADDGEPGNGTGDNTKLRVVNYCTLNGSGAAGVDDSELLDITVKSGYYGFSANRSLFQNSEDPDGYGLGIGGNTDMYSAGWGTQDYTTIGPDNTTSITYQLSPNRDVANNKWKALMSFYVGPTRGSAKGGVNRMLVEGGEFCSINGGGTNPGNENTIGFYFRMKGGWVKGAVYGTASITTANGSRRLVFTGGEVNGWVAGACNGTDFGNDVSTGNYNGINNGICYIYAGGSTEFRSHDGQGNYNNAYGLVGHVEGGQIFGAGRGLAPQRDGDPTYCGSTTTAYVAVADEAYVEQNVYGGGYNGITQNSYVYILGGTVGKKVFGGTARAVSTRVNNNNWWCDKTIIRMYGGTVKGGIYGGHDETGLQYGDAEVTIYGGTVGDPDALNDPSKKGFVHGGGFGDKTVTGGNVIVTIGDDEHAGPTIYGEVYGGSALGNTNATARLDLGTTYPPTPQTVNVVDTTYNPGKVTNVILNKGAVHGNVYGGALGQKNGVNGATSNINAYVFGPVNVTVNGGYAINVFGCNNINGRPRLAVDVFIKGGTIAESVFGGGNMADYIGNPTVTVSGGLVMQHVFGGGFAAEVDGNTFVWVKDRAKIFRNVYGGGNKGVVTGDTQVIVNGEAE